MAYSLEKGVEILKSTVRYSLKHKDYDRVIKIADEYTKFVTGVNIDSLLQAFTPRENAEAFKQRVQLSQLITTDMTNRIAAPMYKIGRTHAEESIVWKDATDSDKKKSELKDCLNNFYGDQSLDTYLNQRIVELDCTDPNSFIIVEVQGEYDPKKPDNKLKPYPFEVNSEEAVNYKYINNELQFLIVEKEYFDYSTKEGKDIELDIYTLYLDNHYVIAKQVLNERVAELAAKFPNQEVFYINPEDQINSEVYMFELIEHKLKRIPAKRIGTRKDLSTRGRTCVPMMHPAYSYFMKSIKTVSEFDLTNCLHVFQKLVQYDEVCPGNQTKNIVCNVGKQPDGSQCPECQGSGWKNHKSAADVIRVRFPKDPKDMVSLQNYMAYFAPEMELLKFQKDFGFYELNELALKAVYTSDLFVSNKVAATATEKSIDLESVYDALKPFADNYSALKMHITYCVATFRNIDKDLSVSHVFPKNFKMESLPMLLDNLAKANTSGAPSYIKEEINRDIAQKLYADKPHELLELEVKASYYPFNGKTVDEINNILLNDLTTQYNKVLYANFETIFAQIEEEQNASEVNFYKMEKTKQSELVKAKVMAILKEINDEQSLLRSANFSANVEAVGGGGVVDAIPSDIEAEAKAKLKGSVGGVQGILEIQASVSQGITDYNAAIALLDEIFGFDEATAKRILGTPKKQTIQIQQPQL